MSLAPSLAGSSSTARCMWSRTSTATGRTWSSRRMCAWSCGASRTWRSSRPSTSPIPRIWSSARRSPRCRPATSKSTPRSRRRSPRRPRSPCPTAPASQPADAAGDLAMWRHNVDLLAYHDLDGRSGLKLALQEAGGRFFLYVAGFWHSGWSILEVTDPEHPELLRFLDGPPNTMTIQVQVADGTMITALEHPPPGLTTGDPHAQPQDGFLIWDVHEPDRPQLLGQWVSGAAGTHRNFYNGGQWVYATSSLPGFEGQVLAIVDIADPANPKTAGTWWHPGQHKAAGETYTPEDQRRLTAGRPYPQHGLSLHGGAYAVGDRAYCPWMRGGMVILDIADKHHPRHVSTLPVYPPLGSTIAVHSAVPLPDRDVVVINSEALREECDEPASYVATVDISDESDPILMSLFPQPRPPRGYDAPSFCEKGGRFGPHNQHQQQGLDCLTPNDRYVYLAYFNAGLQIYDISDPHDPHSTGYFIPDDPKERRGPIPSKLVHQAQDVLVDRRGVIYMSEGNSGIHILTQPTS